MSAYIAQLRRESKIYNAASAAIAAERNKPLAIKVREWWGRLSDEEKYRPYSMEELAKIFNVAPGRIGLGLAELGWIRRRMWTETNYKRYWVAAK